MKSIKMVNTKKGKVTGTKRGKGASNRGEGSNAAARSAEAGADMEELLKDAEDGRSDKERLIEEEAERMMVRWRQMRSREAGQAGSKDSQEMRDKTARDRRTDSGDKTARDRRTDSGAERRVLFRDRSRSRSPPVRSRQKEEELAAMRRQMERMSSKIMQLESGKRWKHKGNEKQFQFAAEVRGIMVDDLRVALEDWFGKNGGSIPSSIEDVVRKGEEKLDERIKMLKLADKGGWEAVDAYVTEPVCDNDEDDKKWKRAVRQVKEDAESKRKKTVWRGLSGYRGGYGGYYGASRRGGYGGYRRPAGMAYSGGRGFLGQGRYVEESRDSKAGSCDAGRKIGAATDVDKLDISEKIAEVSK